MYWAQSIVEVLKAEHIRLIAFVPDSVIARVLVLTEGDDFFQHVPLTREEEQYQITGGQPTPTAGRADLAEIARGAGTEHVVTVETMEEFTRAVGRFLAEEGHWVVVVRVDAERSPYRPHKDPVRIKLRFMEAAQKRA